jgi:hypothetical protein
MSQIWSFDPDRVAHFEASGWRAYYDRDWPTVFRLIVALSHEQFRIPFPMSLLAGYYITRGTMAWAPVNHDVWLAHYFYEKFYRLARRYSGLAFDPSRVADLEMRYNDVHRRLAGQPDKSEFVAAMVDLHAALFGLTPDRARESAEYRVAAATTVDRITSKQSIDVEADWRQLEEQLRQCYRAVQRELGSKAGD